MERFLKSKFKIGNKIAESPFSLTYNGTTLSGERPVIIKIYKRGTLNSSLIQIMKQKVKALQEQFSQKIVPLLDGDYGWQGFYYVRPFIPGQPLSEFIKTKKLDQMQAEEITLQICEALAAAHKRGIVHGALKPTNILIDKDGVKLVDFVIEGAVKESLPQKVSAIIEDIENLSPEELAGSSATSSSDIFAVGCLLYEMLTFKKPFASQLERLRGNMLQNSLIPRHLSEILQKTLEPDPLLRFKNIDDLAESIRRKSIIDTQVDYQLPKIELENTPPPKEVEIQNVKHERGKSLFLVTLIVLSTLAGIIYAVISTMLMR